MHPNPAFRGATAAANLAFARDRGFGVLAVPGGEGPAAGPLLAHVPFLVAADGTQAELHLALSNPILRALPAPAVLAVSGPDGYVSPDWYGLPEQVPTWNYVAVHLRGTLRPLPDEALRGHLDRLAAEFEGRLPKAPWTAAKMAPEGLARMMRAIRPVRLDVAVVDGTWKLSQNKPAAARLGAAGAMGGEIARLMRGAQA